MASLIFEQVENDDLGTKRRKLPGGRATNAATSAGKHHDFVVDPAGIVHRLFTLSVRSRQSLRKCC
jgi:hypothetical protein